MPPMSWKAKGMTPFAIVHLSRLLVTTAPLTAGMNMEPDKLPREQTRDNNSAAMTTFKPTLSTNTKVPMNLLTHLPGTT